jgi:hypothetical protein
MSEWRSDFLKQAAIQGSTNVLMTHVATKVQTRAPLTVFLVSNKERAEARNSESSRVAIFGRRNNVTSLCGGAAEPQNAGPGVRPYSTPPPTTQHSHTRHQYCTLHFLMACPRLNVKGAMLFEGVKQILAIVLVPSPIGRLFRFLSNSLSITTRISKSSLSCNKGYCFGQANYGGVRTIGHV